MPNIKSAIKRVKISAKRRDANKMKVSALRTELKKTFQLIEDGSENVLDRVKHAQKVIDQAATKGRMHKNTAARRKSRLARALQKTAQA